MVLETPKSPEQLKEALNDPGTADQLVKNGKMGDYMADYVSGFVGSEIEREAEKIKDAAILSFIKEHGLNGKRPNMGDDDGPAGKIADGKFKSLGEFCQAIFHQKITMGQVDPRLVRKDMSSGLGSEGGFLVPEEFRAELLQNALEASIVRSRARIIPMSSLTVRIPTVRETTRATTLFGGLTATWTDENETITESQPAFGAVKLELHKLALYTEVPNELFQDSAISLDAFLSQAFGETLAFEEDDTFINGTGSGRPLGVFNGDGLIQVTRTTASEINWDDIVNMYARMMPSSLGSAVWMINSTSFPQLATMALNVGTGGSAIWLTDGTSGPPMTILGRPVIVTEKVPALAAANDISFIDWNQYLIGDGQAITMSTSEHFKFQQDQTAIRGLQRVDGQPWLDTAITPRNGDTLSPYVSLNA